MRKIVGFKTYVDCLHTVLRFLFSFECMHTHTNLMEQLCWEGNKQKNFFKAQKTMFSFSLSFNFSLLIFLFNFTPTLHIHIRSHKM
jgi:hypothetical protein